MFKEIRDKIGKWLILLFVIGSVSWGMVEKKKEEIIRLGNDLVNIAKANRNREVLISETVEMVKTKDGREYKYQITKRGVLSPCKKFIAKIINKSGEADGDVEGCLEYYSSDGKKLFEKAYNEPKEFEWSRWISRCEVMKDGEYIVVQTDNPFMGKGRLEVFNKSGNLVLCEEGIGEDDFHVSPDGWLLFLEKKKDGKTILEKRDLFEGSVWTRGFDSDDIDVTTSGDGNYFICENENKKIVYSFRADGKLLWEKAFSYLRLYPSMWLSEKGKYFIFVPQNYGNIELYDNLSGRLIWKKKEIQIGEYKFTHYNISLTPNEKYIIITEWNFKNNREFREISIGLLDIKGNPLWAGKALVRKDQTEYLYHITFFEKDSLITIWGHSNQFDIGKKIRTIKINLER